MATNLSPGRHEAVREEEGARAIDHLVGVAEDVDRQGTTPQRSAEPAARDRVGRERDDGHARPRLGGVARREAALGEGDDDARADVASDVAGGAGHGLARRSLRGPGCSLESGR